MLGEKNLLITGIIILVPRKKYMFLSTVLTSFYRKMIHILRCPVKSIYCLLYNRHIRASGNAHKATKIKAEAKAVKAEVASSAEFVCYNCQKSFATSSSLRTHLAVVHKVGLSVFVNIM